MVLERSVIKKSSSALPIGLVLLVVFFAMSAMGQSSLEGQIRDTINDLVRLVNVLIIGFVAWAGFLIARGDNSGQMRLIYAVIGLVVVNTANLIIAYFI